MRGTPRRLERPLLLATIAMTVIYLGCDSDQRVVEISRESLNRQAEQNAQMAKQSQAVTETTHELIKAESSVQADANQLQQELHTERSTLDQQRQDLENERRSLAADVSANRLLRRPSRDSLSSSPRHFPLCSAGAWSGRCSCPPARISRSQRS
jgi:septal ring factor EnvC (AmiA/AmiB activator)